MMIKICFLIMFTRRMHGWNFMKNIRLSSSPALVPALPTVQTDPKYCVNCKYFIVNPNLPNNNSRGRCNAFPFEDYLLEPPINTVSGEQEGELEYHERFYACSSSRGLDNKCGKDGKHFIPKDPNTDDK